MPAGSWSTTREPTPTGWSAFRRWRSCWTPARDTWENWGGLTLPGSWYHDCLYYSWPDGTPATNWLDSTGRIGPDGKGFVEKDGKIYRIAFTVQNEEN